MWYRMVSKIFIGILFIFQPATSFVSFNGIHRMRCQSHLPATSADVDAATAASNELKVAIVGGGPSGLLLAHLLLLEANTQVTVWERRDDPRNKNTEQRAYALGVGIRGRSAIRRVDEELWQTVKKRGYESERFQLHIGGLVIPLRSEEDGGRGVEPSLLLYQSELCAGLLEELERRHASSGRLKLNFGSRARTCNLDTMTIVVDNDAGPSNDNFDLIVGCDGVNSIVRAGMLESFPAFESIKEQLPGEFKVVRLDAVPPSVDPTSVSLILPKKGSSGAFVEPTGSDGSCCILFSGRGDTPILKETKNVTAVVETLKEAFPQWPGFHEPIAEKLVAQSETGTAASVVCNIYNFGGKAALAGDAAHATGGVSGQGVNSALCDSVVLASCIRENRDDLAKGLLEYSCRQVPEGKALYDLSFGPTPKGFRGLEWSFLRARDSLFRGRWGIGRLPLQTQLTTTLTPFSEIRRGTDKFYDSPFPSDEAFRAVLTNLHKAASEKAESPTTKTLSTL